MNENPKPQRGLPPWAATLLLLLCAVAVVALMARPAGAHVDEAPQPQDAVDSGAAAQSHVPVQKAKLDLRPTLVLDAGHGGNDPGAVDETGTVYENTLNQTVLDKLLVLLAAHEEALRVVQAAAPGTSASIMQRANTAVQQEAELLLSLHLNADTSPNTRGFQCFPTPPGRAHHAGSLRFGQLLVQQVADTGVPILGQSGIFYCYYVFGGSAGYAKEVVDAAWVDAENPRADESFGIVEYGGCPAVLIEMWHISSPDDMALFNTDSGCDAMARAIYLAVCDYFSLEAEPA